MKTLRCPACGAPISGKDNQDNGLLVCQFCGSRIELPQKQGNEINEVLDNILETLKTINGDSTSIHYFLKPNINDAKCKKKVVEQLVHTDFVPSDIFSGFRLDNIKRKFYPFYIYSIDWSANWSATFTKQVSHEEPTYDIYGKLTGKRTVYETKYRDVVGASSGNKTIVLPGCSKIPQAIDVAKLLVGKLTKAQKSFDDFEKEEYKDWTVVNPSLTSNEAWEKQEKVAKQQIESDVEIEVLSDIRRKADGWTIQDKDCTWKYYCQASRCVIIPLWTAEYEYDNHQHLVTVEANKGKVFLHYPIPQNDDEYKKKYEKDKDADSVKRNQTIFYWLFSIFGAIALTFFILLFSMGHNETSWTFPLSVLFMIITGGSFYYARLFHQKKNNVKNETDLMLYESKEKRKKNAKKELGYDINIGEAPQKKSIDRTVDFLTYIALLVLTIVSVFKFVDNKHQIQAENIYNETKEKATEQMKARAVGSYYCGYEQNFCRITLNKDGTAVAELIDSYDNEQYHSFRRNGDESRNRSGTWTVGDPFKEMDIIVELSGFGLLGNKLLLSNNSIYEDSYSSKEISKLITENQFNAKKETVRQRYSNKSWEKKETIGYGYDSEDFTNRLEIKPNGTCVLSGRYWKTIDYYDYNYGMYRYYNKNVNTSCVASWEVILITPKHNSAEPINMLEDKYWGIVISVDKNAELPQWTRDLHYVNEYSYGSDKHDNKYLIVNDNDVPLNVK